MIINWIWVAFSLSYSKKQRYLVGNSSPSTSFSIGLCETTCQHLSEGLQGGSICGSEPDVFKNVPEELFFKCSSSEVTGIGASDRKCT